MQGGPPCVHRVIAFKGHPVHRTQLPWAAMASESQVLEHIVLNIRDGEAPAFERTFAQAKELLAASPGFIALELQRCLETENRYLLLVQWERLEDHLEGFRGSPAFDEWRGLLHHFYDPAPTVEHYRVIATA